MYSRAKKPKLHWQKWCLVVALVFVTLFVNHTRGLRVGRAAAELSPGCREFNGPQFDAMYFAGGFGMSMDFFSGEQIVVTAGPPDYLIPRTIVLDRITAPYPGTIVYTVPSGDPRMRPAWWIGEGATATWEVSCEAPPPPTTVSGVVGYAINGANDATLAAFFRAGSTPLPSGRQVKFTFNGQTFTGITDEHGVATVIAPLPGGPAPGDYVGAVHASYPGAKGYAPGSGNGPLMIVASACGGRFYDVPVADPACTAIAALAEGAIINGYATYPPKFGPNDGVQRAQVAAFLVRALQWQDKPTSPRFFTDFGALVAELQTASLILANQCDERGDCVGKGYAPADCATKGKVAPCFGPNDGVTKAQVISLIARAFAFSDYFAWVPHPDEAIPYTGVPEVHLDDLRTYHFYAGAVPDAPNSLAGWNAIAPREWIARVLYQALTSASD